MVLSLRCSNSTTTFQTPTCPPRDPSISSSGSSSCLLDIYWSLRFLHCPVGPSSSCIYHPYCTHASRFVQPADPPPPVHLTDLSGSTPSFLFQTISAALPNSTSPSSTALLVAPAYAFDLLPASRRHCAREVFAKTTGVHVDMDRLGDLFAGGWERSGVGVWEIMNEGCWKATT